MTTSWTNPRRLLLNADVGEVAARVLGGDEALLFPWLDVANIACGGHAGDDDTMLLTLKRCRDAGVVVVAHPGYPDRDGFGRRRLALAPDDLLDSLRTQVEALVAHAAAVGASVTAIKPLGALYHAVDDDAVVAAVFADLVDALAHAGAGRLPLVLSAAHRSTTSSRRVLSARGVDVVGEVFVDRGVDAAGHLLPRGTPGALLTVAEAQMTTRVLAARFRARQHLTADDEHRFATACVHGDGPQALAIAVAARAVLDEVCGPR
jgi:UPF0271 protein